MSDNIIVVHVTGYRNIAFTSSFSDNQDLKSASPLPPVPFPCLTVAQSISNQSYRNGQIIKAKRCICMCNAVSLQLVRNSCHVLVKLGECQVYEF